MFSITRTLFTLLFSVMLLSPGLAQTRRPNAQTTNPIVTATTSNRRVRYVSVGEVNHTQLQVFSPDGIQVYDSELRLGNLIDWPLLDQKGQQVPDGSYLFLITVKEFSGVLTQKYGTVLLESEEVSLQQIARDELPQAQALALHSNKLSEVLSPIDRIGALSFTPTVANNAAPAVAPVPSGKQTTTTTIPPGGENISGTGSQNRIAKWTVDADTLGDSAIYESGGQVGIGTTSPEGTVHIESPDTTVFKMVTSGNVSTGRAVFQMYGGTSATANGWDFGYNTDRASERFIIRELTNGGVATRLAINKGTGNVGIGTSNPQAKLDVSGDLNVSGNANISGNIAAKYQDVAEWVQARQPMAPGTVVSLDRTRRNAVTPSRYAYDGLIAGVVSAQPGVILGEAGAGKVMVTMSGRVIVKVDARRYPIRIGDLLVTSNKPGVAMRSRPIRVAGKLIHRPGTIIGKALEALPNGIGEILVLVALH